MMKWWTFHSFGYLISSNWKADSTHRPYITVIAPLWNEAILYSILIFRYPYRRSEADTFIDAVPIIFKYTTKNGSNLQPQANKQTKPLELVV